MDKPATEPKKDNHAQNTFTGVIFLIIAVAVISAYFKNTNDGKKAEEAGNTVVKSAEKSTTTAPSPKEVTVVYSGTAFFPAAITLNKGDTVIFKNESNKSFWPASNDHPSHLLYKEFDPGKSIRAGETYSFTFMKVGTWGFHNHLEPSQTGVVMVK